MNITAKLPAIILLLANLLTAQPNIATGTRGCKPYAGFCYITADGAGHAAGTCEDYRTFTNASVAKKRQFAPDALYHVTGCADGQDSVKRVKIGYRLN